MFNGENIFNISGTGSLGKMYTNTLLEQFNPIKITIYTRDKFNPMDCIKTNIPNALCSEQITEFNKLAML